MSNAHWHRPGEWFVSPAYWESGQQPGDRKISIKDATLQEGEDALGVQLTWDDRHAIAERLFAIGVPEIKIPVYSDMEETKRFVGELNERGIACRKSSPLFFKLPYADGFDWKAAIKRRVDLGIDSLELGLLTDPGSFVTDFRGPISRAEIVERIGEMIEAAVEAGIPEPGYGHPWGTSLRTETFLEFHRAAVEAGARRIFVWDSNGIGSPAAVGHLVRKVKEVIGSAEIVYHGHNDLGLGTANNLAAVEAGADWCDLTVNGLGDRSGNSSLEEVATVLTLHGYNTGLDLTRLYELSQFVQERTGARVQTWKPIVGMQSCIEEGEAHYHIARNAIRLGMPEHPMGYNPTIVGREYTNVFGSTTLRGAVSWGNMLEIKLGEWGIDADPEGLETVRVALAEQVQRHGYVSESELREIAEGVLVAG